MKLIPFILLLIFFSSCASDKPDFKKEKVCSNESLKYLKNPRNRYKQSLNNPNLNQELSSTSRSMQLCYDEYKRRSGVEEFSTCLVVGVDDYGELEFYNFHSREIELDQTFLNCAKAVTSTVPYGDYGSNYILIQSYQFYLGEN